MPPTLVEDDVGAGVAVALVDVAFSVTGRAVEEAAAEDELTKEKLGEGVEEALALLWGGSETPVPVGLPVWVRVRVWKPDAPLWTPVGWVPLPMGKGAMEDE